MLPKLATICSHVFIYVLAKDLFDIINNKLFQLGLSTVDCKKKFNDYMNDNYEFCLILD